MVNKKSILTKILCMISVTVLILLSSCGGGTTAVTQPPSSVSNLTKHSRGTTWISCTWTNPSDNDFSKAILYIDEKNIANVSNNLYNFTELNPDTKYKITIHTKDNTGNVNNTDVNIVIATLKEGKLIIRTEEGIYAVVGNLTEEMHDYIGKRTTATGYKEILPELGIDVLKYRILECGNQICDAGETAESCPEDCYLHMLIFISPQYANNEDIESAVNEYITAVKDDIDWNIKIIKLSESTNTIGKIRDIIKSHYSQYRIKVALMIGEDIKTQLNSETPEIDSPSTLLWEEFNEPLTFYVMEIRDSRWQGINLYEDGILVGSMSHTVQPEATAKEIDSLFPYYNNNPDNYLQFAPYFNISKPEVFVSLLYPPKEYDYGEKVNKIVSALERFSTSRTRSYGNSIQAFTYVKELALGINKPTAIDYEAFAELGDLDQTIDCDTCNIDFDKEYKLFIADGHADPSAVWITGLGNFNLNAENISELKTPYFYGHGCNVGGWYSANNLNGILDQTSECKCYFSSTLCCKPIIAEQIFNSDYLRIIVSGGSGSPDETYWSNFISALKSGKTIAEAHTSIKSKIRFVFYGDPTFHYTTE